MINKIEDSIKDKTIEEFMNDINLFDATLMRLHFIGETIKSVPFSVKKNYKKVRWRKFSRLRNIIRHRYSNVNKNIIWDVTKALGELKIQLKEILEKENVSLRAHTKDTALSKDDFEAIKESRKDLTEDKTKRL